MPPTSLQGMVPGQGDLGKQGSSPARGISGECSAGGRRELRTAGRARKREQQEQRFGAWNCVEKRTQRKATCSEAA